MRCPCCGSHGPCRRRGARYQPAPGADPYRAGSAGPLILLAGILAAIGFWPAMVWHGYGGPTGTAWRWDVHSTIACCIWWGACALVSLLVYADRRAARRRAVPPSMPPAPAPPRPQKRLATPPAADWRTPEAPPCTHPAAVPVNELFGPLREPGRLVAWWCPEPPEGCGTQLDAAFRSAELTPDGSWPPIRRRP